MQSVAHGVGIPLNGEGQSGAYAPLFFAAPAVVKIGETRLET